MKEYSGIVISALCFVLSIVFGVYFGLQAQGADIVLRNGVIQTMVNENDVHEAVAIQDGEIIYVGNDTDVEEYIGSNTEVIDLNGQMVTPGFMDSHIHSVGTKLTELYQISLYGLKTLDEYKKAITDFIAAHPEMEIAVGGTFDINLFKVGDKTVFDRSILDNISTTQAIGLNDVSGHALWANSKALEIMGVDKNTPEENGCIIDKDANGELTGYLVDCWDFYDKLTVEYTDEQIETASLAFYEQANIYGVTGVQAMIHDGFGVDSSAFLTNLDEQEKMSIRMNIAYTLQPGTTIEEALKALEENSKSTSNLVTNKSVKMFYDGVTEGGSALMLEPYKEAAGKGDNWYGGDSIWPKEEFQKMVVALDKAGYQINVHAIGDRSVREVLDAFELAQKTNGKRDSRHVLIHDCTVSEEDRARFSELGVIAAYQFLWMYKDPLYELEKAFVGEERALAFYPIKILHDLNTIITGGSDSPVTDFNPLEQIEVGITRNSPYPGEEDTDLYRWKEQALTPYQMLEIYTKNVAYQMFLDDEIGTIEVGKKADVVVLSDNILKIDPKKISDVKVQYTIVDGNIVYQAN